MKKINTNKLLSIYIVWVILHFFLWFIGGSWGWYSKYDDFYRARDLSKFYPFQAHYWYFDPRKIYDLSELVIYVFLPLLLFFAYKLWTRGKKIE